jgi:hypothetical protein
MQVGELSRSGGHTRTGTLMNVRYTFGLLAMVAMAGCTTVGSTLPPTRSIDTGRALPAIGVVATPTPAPKHTSTGRALPAFSDPSSNPPDR